MRLALVTRLQALTAVRCAVGAAGLGIGWLLLSGGAASASDNLLGAPVPAPVAAVAAPVTGPVTAVAAPVTNRAGAVSAAATAPLAAIDGPAASALPVLSEAQRTAGAAIQQTTAALAQAVEAAPAVADPVLTGPLSPLAPVVGSTAAGTGQTVQGIGDTVGTAVAAPVPETVAQLPNTVTQLPDTVAQVPAGIADPPLGAAPPAAGGPSDLSAPGIPVGAPASAPNGAPSVDIVPPATPGLLGLAQRWPDLATLAATGWGARGAGSPLAPTGDPSATPPPAPWDGGAGSGGSSDLTGGSGSPAALFLGFFLAPLLPVSSRAGVMSDRAPSSPAFDPGSTPD